MTSSVRTDLRMPFHLEHLDAFDNGGAGVVDAVEHGLAGVEVSDGSGGERGRRALSWIMVGGGCPRRCDGEQGWRGLSEGKGVGRRGRSVEKGGCVKRAES